MENAAFLPIAPEVVLLLGALAVILSAVLFNRDRTEWGIMAGLSFVVAFVFSVLQWRVLDVDESAGELFFSAREVPLARTPMVVMDPYSAFAGMVLFAVGLVGLFAAWKLISKLGPRGAEFVTLVLLGVAGLHMMVMSGNLIMMFLGLETASISFYVLAGFTRERSNSDEAAVKYFLLGSLAAAIFIYGAALVFAGTGSTSFYGAGSISAFLAGTIVADPGILLIGIALLVVGLSFKVSAAPFHEWAPDVYQGAPSGAVGLMAAGVKVAGFAALGRVLIGALPSQIDDWAPAVAVIAGLSMIVGSLFAAVQTDVKRILAYSGIAHAGYILVAFVAGREGIGSMWFYVSTYAFALLGAFAVAAVVAGSRRGRSSLDEWAGLSSRSPELAWVMLVLLLGMGGIPFTAGFIAKVGVFTVAAEAGYLWLVILALITTVVALYAYLRVVAAMFMRSPVAVEAPGTAPADPRASGTTRVVLVVAVVITLLFGIIPWPLLEIAREALPL
jgi:NADH-quinone oxidoreductase subunit N